YLYLTIALTSQPCTPTLHDALPILRCRQPFGRVPTRLRAHQDPTSIADVRPMVPGDSPRFIHWKASARRGELHVKEFELRASTEDRKSTRLNSSHVNISYAVFCLQK